MFEKMGYCGALLFLGCLSRYDIHWKKIPVWTFCVFGSIAVLYFLVKGETTFTRIIFLMLPGLFLLFIAALTGEKIGYGDGLTVLVLGFFVGGRFCLETVCFGFILAGVYFVCAYLVGKREKQIPFVPFLLVGMEVMLLYA